MSHTHSTIGLIHLVMAWLFIGQIVTASVAIDYKNSVDIVIFSYHRPMQLYALCESLQRYTTAGRGLTHVIYRADSDEYRAAYALVHNDFPDLIFMQQSGDPHADFKPLTLQATFESPSDYVMFAVDDIIVKDTINFGECIQALQQTGAYGFYLRLGTNLTECYMMACAQKLPRLHVVTPAILAWQLQAAPYDWGYPHTVDMTIYRKADIKQALTMLSYTNPNLLEGYWAQQAIANQFSYGLCYRQSKIVNIPCNRVQQVYEGNRYMNSLSAQELLELFVAGKKIAIEDFTRINNTAAHAEYAFRFSDR